MNIIKAERLKDGTIMHEIKEGEKTRQIRYQGIRAGISWDTVAPAISAPAYYCIVGQEWTPKPYQGQEKEKGVLRLISEYESPSLMDREKFFRRLTDDTTRFCCWSCYADIESEEGEENPRENSLRNYVNEHEIHPAPTMYQAPYVEDFLHGIQEINNLRGQGLIDIGKGPILLDQLKRIEEKDLTSIPEIRFYAVNSLRHVVTSFAKIPAYMPRWTPTRLIPPYPG